MSIISGPTTGKETTRSRPSGPGMPTGHQALAVGSPIGVLPEGNRNVANSRSGCNTESAQRCRRQGKKLRRQPWTVCEALWCLFGTYSEWESPVVERCRRGSARAGKAAWMPPLTAHGWAPDPRGLCRRRSGPRAATVRQDAGPTSPPPPYPPHTTWMDVWNVHSFSRGGGGCRGAWGEGGRGGTGRLPPGGRTSRGITRLGSGSGGVRPPSGYPRGDASGGL